MSRKFSTRINEAAFDEETIEAVWKKGTPEPNLTIYRKDRCGASMQ